MAYSVGLCRLLSLLSGYAVKNKKTHRPMSNSDYAQKNKSAILLKRKIAEQFRLAGDYRTADKLDACTETEELVMCSNCGGRWWVRSRCRLRVCPICSRDKARDRATYLTAVANEQPDCKMLTLTMRRWSGDPKEGIKYLRVALRKFRQLKCMEKCNGGAYVIECLPKQGAWHIHAHLIVSMPYLPAKKLWSVWAHCVGQRYAHVRIQAANSDRVKRYICKYASKSGIKDIGLENIVAWYEAVKGSRLWATFGAWYNRKLNDMIDGKDEQDNRPACPYCGAQGTTFLARAGPFVLGPDWRAAFPVGTAMHDFSRPNTDLINSLA
jgi:hypothetical protein